MATKTKFFKRLLKFKHMEFDAAGQQLLWAIMTPKKLYRHHEAQYKTRESWSRDDPAFLVCICAFLLASTLGYSLFLRLGIGGFFLALMMTEFLDCIVSGLVVATAMWLICNKLLLKKSSKESVEWGYCLDVHLNAFVPLAVIVFGIQMILVIVLQYKTTLFTVISDILWVCALCCYIYSTFLGYSVMGRLENTVLILCPVLPLLAMCVISIPLKWNYTRWFVYYYKSRIGLG